MKVRFKIPPAYILGHVMKVLCNTRILEYKFCNACSIMNMSYINLMVNVDNLYAR